MYKPLSYIEISKKNIIHNVKSLRKVAKPGTKFAFAVKGNAYGHGLKEVVKIAAPYADYFMVNSIEELRMLRKVSKKRVLLLGYVANSDIAEAIQLGCIVGVYSIESFKTIAKIAEKIDKKVDVHIACDAYLGREGFLKKDLENLFRLLQVAGYMSHVSIAGMYAHFANIEDTTSFTHAKKQIDGYREMITLAHKHGYKNILTHISATSGLLIYEKENGYHPLVRVGIGMYGLWPSEEIGLQSKNLTLKPVLSWKTHVAQIKTVAKGSTIGYGLTYVTKKPTTLALIPQGYADGYPRALSNKGMVLIGGKYAKILGRVSMNMFVVDVTNIQKVRVEDVVVLLGTQGKNTLTAEMLARWALTINYEIVTRISPLLPRIIN